MPVIVVGADTPLGGAVMAALSGRDGELRAFVTSGPAGSRLRTTAVRVAVGDISDGSHIAGAAFGCFSAVLLAEAASDDRERSFLPDPPSVLDAWADAVAEAGVTRAIWVGMPAPREATPETCFVSVEDRSPAEIAAEVVELDDRPAA